MPDAIAASRPSWRPEQRRAGLDPDIKRMAVIAAALGAGMAVGVTSWGVWHHTAGKLPVVSADPGPVRVRPADPGGMQVAGTDDSGPPQTAERLAPPPEQPEIALLRAKLRAARHALALAEAAKVAALQKAAAIVPASIVQRPTPRVAAPVLPASLPAPPPIALAPADGGLAVQLGAFESEAAAHGAWSGLAAKAPGVLNGLSPVILRADLAGRAIYRLRTGSFASTHQAAEFCGRVRDSGGDCSVAAF